MGHLYVVKQDHIFQLHRVSHHTIRAYQRAAADKGAVAHLRAGADDAGRAQKRCGRHRGSLMNPDSGGHFPVAFAQLGAKGENQSFDAAQRLPGIVKSGKVLPGNGVGQIIQLVNF